MRVLVTGTAGFIGFHVARRLLEEGQDVVGFDAFTAYYDVALKERRNSILAQRPRFRLVRGRLEDGAALAAAWQAAAPDVVIHLAAQAGVRYSLEQPQAYIDANIAGTFNVLELARRHPLRHLLLASTSSLYGANTELPYREAVRAARPLSLYAATKGATELMAHSYAHLWRIPTTVFRFFTVYGPWGRPDMALFKFTKGILEGTPIDIYNHGDMRRDFTFIDDLVEAVWRLIACVPPADPSAAVDGDTLSPAAPYRIVNIGNGAPVNLLDFVAEIERCLNRKAVRNMMAMQKGDVPVTFASADLLERLTGFRPRTPVADGVRAFVDWYRAHHGA